MRPAVQAPFVALVYALTATAGFVAISRVVGDNAPLPAHGPRAPGAERIAWLLTTVVLFIVAIALYFTTKHTERDECAHTHRERPCQAQRNATIYSGTLVLTHGAGVVGTFLAAVTLVHLRHVLTAYGALAAFLMSVWYFVSTVPYAPLPRMPPLRPIPSRATTHVL